MCDEVGWVLSDVDVVCGFGCGDHGDVYQTNGEEVAM